jgi:predicted nucleic acid-binding Zn ribbon protein
VARLRTRPRVRRQGPHSLAAALERVAWDVAPATSLARAQRAWPEAAGATVARESQPASERAGVLTVACRSATWAQELELMSGELRTRLNAALSGAAERGPIREIRFVTRSTVSRY